MIQDGILKTYVYDIGKSKRLAQPSSSRPALAPRRSKASDIRAKIAIMKQKRGHIRRPCTQKCTRAALAAEHPKLNFV
jgi:hypothetical protein